MFFFTGLKIAGAAGEVVGRPGGGAAWQRDYSSSRSVGAEIGAEIGSTIGGAAGLIAGSIISDKFIDKE